MNYGFDDDEDILDENADFSYIPSNNAASRRNPRTSAVNPPVNQTKVAAPQVKSHMNYDDFNFSDDENDKVKTNEQPKKPETTNTSSVVPRVRGGRGVSAAQEDAPSQQALYVPSPAENRVDRQKQSSALPPIQSMQHSSFDDDLSTNLKSKRISVAQQQQAVSAKKKKDESDIEDELDDLDDIVASTSPVKNIVPSKSSEAEAAEKKRKQQQEDEAKKKQQQQEEQQRLNKKREQEEQERLRKKRELEELEKKNKLKQNFKDDDDYEEDLYEEAYEQDDDDDFNVNNANKQQQKPAPAAAPASPQKKQIQSDVSSELSELPELEYDNPPTPKKSAPQSAYLKNPITLDNRSTRVESPQPPPPRIQSRNSNRSNGKSKNFKSVPAKKSIAVSSSRDVRGGGLPKLPTSKNKQNHLEADRLKELLRDRDYGRMTFQEIKAENDALREKLKAFNNQLTEKVEQNKYKIEKNAVQNSQVSHQTRSRSGQMRTADAEMDNNFKIMKRLEEELTKLQQRQALLEGPKYLSNLKLQIETSQNLINKFKLQTKQITLKSEQKAKELAKIMNNDGVSHVAKEGHAVQQDFQLLHDKKTELERRKAELEDLFVRKNEAIEAKEIEYKKKLKEAKALGVSLNFEAHHMKRVTKYRELQKMLVQWEKSNQTLVKMHKTKEAMYIREMDDISRDLVMQDDDISSVDVELIAVKKQVKDTIENEKIYPSRDFRKFLGRESSPRAYEMNNLSQNASDQMMSARKDNRSPNAVESNRQETKPQMKFKKFNHQMEPSSNANAHEDEKPAAANANSENGINFHSKMHPRNLSNDMEAVSSKPFTLKKGAPGAASEATIQNSDSDLLSTNEAKSSENASAKFNFKQKLAGQSQQTSVQESMKQEQPAPTAAAVTETKPAAEQENSSIFDKPSRMFKFKKHDNNTNTTSATTEAVGAEVKPVAAQPTVSNQNDEGGYSFSTSSRVSRVRGGAKEPAAGGAVAISIPEEPTEAPKPKAIDNDAIFKPVVNDATTNSTSATGGYQFSGAGGSSGTVPRRRGNPVSSGFENTEVKQPEPVVQQQQPVNNNNNTKPDNNDQDIIVPSRRNRGQARNESAYDPTTAFGNVLSNNETQPEEKKNNHTAVEPESKWGWNSNNNNTVTNNNNNNNSGNAVVKTNNDSVASKGFGSALDTPFQAEPAPKTFNFKRNQAATAVEQPTATQTNNVPPQQPAVVVQEKPVAPQTTVQQQPQFVAPKKDEYTFKGPNERRVTSNRPTNNDANKKVIKRDIFADEPAEITVPGGFVAPKEIGAGSSSQQPAVNKTAAPKRSALDDDDDIDGGGLDFLKQDQPKVNYNDDDDDIFATKKPAAANAGGIGGQSKINASKANPNAKQEKEKNLASKANNDDFFDDLF